MLTDSQFWAYLHAEQELEEIERVYQAERQEAYGGIAPTITGFDYGSGRIYKLACHVEEYAIYLVELYEKRNQRMEKVKKRIEVLEEAVSLLYDDERAQYETWKANPVDLYPDVLKTLRECVSFVLERDQIKEEAYELSVTEWDAQIEAMDEDELFSDYGDRDGSFDNEIKKRQEKEKQYGRVDLSERALQNYADKFIVKDRFHKAASCY
ncbi:hypothetical protein AMS59_15890 [Lysinibacillus sp. FJAT-14745]|uniref:hypothetical protein n=1 Tax=Lysinibacillus sp. FJAT-14745 TaxID=1704289 RepID=UPI0006AB9AA7|nr:hypothetical protein [Lysinibacillus sp. FJAT-14745]KOP72411.1 hypothetical protein AMS59_15890 [Lysinibacillus sp. FJAT-14745]